MLAQIYSFDSVLHIFIYYTAILSIFFYVIYYNRDGIFSCFSDFKKRYLGILAVVLLIYISFIFFSDIPYIGNVAGWELNWVAKGYASGDYIFIEHGTFTPYLLSISFYIFGVSVSVIKNFYISLAVASAFLVFIVAYLVSQDEKISLLSTLVFILAPIGAHFMVFTGGRTTTAVFSFTLMLVCFILSLKIKRPSGFLLGLTSLLIAGNTQLDLMVFLPLYVVIYFYMKSDLIHKNTIKIFIFLLVFALFSFHYIAHAVALQNVNQNTARDNLISKYRSKLDINNSRFKAISNYLLNDLPETSAHKSSFSFSYFFINLLVFIKSWFFESLTLLILLILGSIASYKEKYVKIFLLIFITYSIVHMLYLYPYGPRFMVIKLPIVSIVSSFGVASLIRSKGHKYDLCAPLKVLTVLSIFAVSTLLVGSAVAFKERPGQWYDDVNLAKSLVEKTGDDCVITEIPRFEVILNFFKNKNSATSFHNLRSMDNKQLDYLYSGKLNISYFSQSQEFSNQRDIIKNFIDDKDDVYIFLEDDCKYHWMSVEYKTEPGYYICKYLFENYRTKKIPFNTERKEEFTLYKLLSKR